MTELSQVTGSTELFNLLDDKFEGLADMTANPYGRGIMVEEDGEQYPIKFWIEYKGDDMEEVMEALDQNPEFDSSVKSDVLHIVNTQAEVVK